MLLECPHCHARNQVPAGRFDDGGTCGHCERPLVSGVPVALNDDNFADVIAASERPVVVDFSAAWCAPCKSFAPVFAAAAAKSPAVLFAHVETEANPHVTSRYAVRSVPTVAVFRHAHLEERSSGALSAEQFDAWLRYALA
jgi:thioredoxin 2